MGMSLHAADFETATEAVKNMGIGWNLGNALEADIQQNHDPSQSNYWGQQDLSSETCWGQFYTKSELMAMMKNAGFGAIRVPVTWYNHLDEDGNVNAQWMNRVHEVVDYVINQGMYCILNIHHDTGADSDNFTSWMKADPSNYTTNKVRFEKLWTQIANEFKDYDQHLLFEGYNEMLDASSSWNFAQSSSAYDAINNYAQSFVNAVRATGGNNAQRNLIVNSYGACCGIGSWNTNLKEPVKQLKKPDGETNHVIFEVHSYLNIENLTSAKASVDELVSVATEHLVSKGAPVIIGEWGTSNVDAGAGKTDYDLRRSDMFEFVDYFVRKMKANNIGIFYWMGLSDGLSRLFPVFSQADLAKKMLQAYHGDSFSPTLPSMDDFSDINFSCTVNYTDQYGEFNLFKGSIEASDYKHLRLELGAVPVSGSLSFKVYSTSGKSQTITAKNTNFQLSGLGTISQITLQWHKETAGSVHINKVYLVKQDNSKEYSNPGVSWGCNITDLVITTGIETVTADSHPGDGRIYNLNGQQVTTPWRGIYIQNEKKYIKH